MTTLRKDQAAADQVNDKKSAFVCACCLTIIPVIYLLGITVKGFLG
jgi:hypothetical protein